MFHEPARAPRLFGTADAVEPLTEKTFPPPPPWRDFSARQDATDQAAEAKFRGGGLVVDEAVVDAVNVALVLRRPLLVTGRPGTGKSSLAYAVAHRLALGRVLVWPITSRSTLKHGLYDYDAVARLEDAARAAYHAGGPPGGPPTRPRRRSIGRYIRLGPLGTALLPAELPRVLLIDEIDKGDVDLPNDLLHVFEEGRFRIDELARLPRKEKFNEVPVLPHDADEPTPVPRAGVQCDAFPVVVMTSNGEREFPPAFLRRCVRLTVPDPTAAQLADIVRSRLLGAAPVPPPVQDLIDVFVQRRDAPGPDGGKRELAVDQLLNAVHLLLKDGLPDARRDLVFRSLTEAGGDAK